MEVRGEREWIWTLYLSDRSDASASWFLLPATMGWDEKGEKTKRHKHAELRSGRQFTSLLLMLLLLLVLLLLLLLVDKDISVLRSSLPDALGKKTLVFTAQPADLTAVRC